MKAITLLQPYAWGATMGFVTSICDRRLQRHHGPVLIHASAIELTDHVDGLLQMAAEQTGTDYALLRNSYRTLAAADAIVGAATVTDTIAWQSWSLRPDLTATLAEAARAISPVACPSGRGFFDAPDDVLQKLDIPGYVEATG